MENNYGDAHFRRTDNAQAMHNPFVGNLIMDAFTTEVGGEVYFRKNGFIAMFGLSNGKLNQAVNNPETTGASILAKLGYDAQVSEDLRLRLTGSMYSTGKSGNVYLYSADRSGSRYYLVMEDTEASTSGNFRDFDLKNLYRTLSSHDRYRRILTSLLISKSFEEICFILNESFFAII